MAKLDPAEPEGPRRQLICDLLLHIAHEETLVLSSLAAQHHCSEAAVEQSMRAIRDWGLAQEASDDDPAFLLHVGEQFLARRGEVPIEALEFLGASSIDDLNAREALRRASSRLVDELADACAAGRLVEHARGLVPPAFVAAVDAPIAARLYAAAPALVVRLARSEPPGCVAEELLAVRLIDLARVVLEAHEDVLGSAATAHATDELSGMFDLIEDHDVLQMFAMRDPGDAAVAGHDAINRQIGTVDQRIEAWFQPFGWTVPAGHLHDIRTYRWP